MVHVGLIFSLSLPLLFATHTSGNNNAKRQLATGDKQCGTTICISAAVNGSSVEYVLSSTGRASVGWMGIGFGRQMANTPMVIMWPNADGSVTLSQRTAPREVMPTLDPNPPRVAKLSDSLTSVLGQTPSLGFTIPADGDIHPRVIYAFSSTPPGSSASNANLVQHIEFGRFTLDLTRSSPPSKTTSTSRASSTSTSKPSPTHTGGGSHDPFPPFDPPLRPYERLIIAHAIFSVVGFLVFLPAGALLARYLRTFTPTWFTGHWIAQFGVAGPTIIAGVTMGILSVSKAGALHLNDPHKQLGITLLVIYSLQCALGAVIHWVKPRLSTRRPIQNYLHAVLGLLIIALAMYQVYSGYHIEWTRTTGREPFPVTGLYFGWTILIIVLYFVGLSLLPKQLRQESESRQQEIQSGYQELNTDDLEYHDQDGV